MSKATSSNDKRRWAFIALAMLSLIVAFLLIAGLDDTADVKRRDAPIALPIVTVIERQPRTARATVSSFAQVRALWEATLRANVSGLVVEVSDKALTGARVNKGDVLLRLEDSELQAQLLVANQAVLEARFALVRAQNQTDLARNAAKRGGVAKPTELTLRLPELRLAKQAVSVAEAQEKAAATALSYTTISAPFDGFVSRRSVSLGQTVSIGEDLLTLVDNQRFELDPSLSQQQWALLKHPIANNEVRIENRAGNLLALGRVRDAGGFLDTQTREYKVFVDVHEQAEESRVLSGDLLQVVFQGKAVDNTLTLPECCLSRQGHIWYLDSSDRLLRASAEVLWRDGANVIVKVPSKEDKYRVVLIPLASFLPGQKLAPKLVEAK